MPRQNLKVVANPADFPIIKGAALPSGPRRKYPFDQMEVGDAFDVPFDIEQSARNASWAWGKVNGRKFSCRKIDGSTLRIFRVA